MDKNSRIVVIGSNGFVGSNLLSELNKKGYDAKGISRDDCNLLNLDEVQYMFNKLEPDYLFNCSAIVGGIQANIKDPYKFLFENLQIQNNLINEAIKHKTKKFLNLGSSCIYPANYIQPLKEEYLLKGDLEKTNEGYALAKICGLKMCEYANKQFDTKFISLMPANLYGKNDCFDLGKSHVLSALIKKIYDSKKNNIDFIEIWGTGKARREFLYVDDLIDCMIWSMENLDKTETFLNVGTGEDISIMELAKKISEMMDWNGEIKSNLSKPDGMLLKRMDVSKINSLGWKAKTPFNDGLKATINWFINNQK